MKISGKMWEQESGLSWRKSTIKDGKEVFF